MILKHKKYQFGDRVFDAINMVALTSLLFIVFYPMYFIVIASISSPEGIYTNKVWLLPYEMSFDGYRRIFGDALIWFSYRNSLFYMAAGTLINIVITVPAGYVLSRKDFVGRNKIMALFVFTMFFSGGLIPTYLTVRQLGMVDTVWALLIPNAMSVFNMVITRTFFMTTLPDELLDAGKIDGCSNMMFFFKIALPLASPILMVLSLFYGEGHWNSFFDALIYLRNAKLYPLPIVLRNILTQNDVSMLSGVDDIESMLLKQRIVEQIKYGLFMVSSLPLLIIYPFLQRYFEKGVMIGALKG